MHFGKRNKRTPKRLIFIFYDHEFVGDTSKLTPLAKKHLEQVAKRLSMCRSRS